MDLFSGGDPKALSSLKLMLQKEEFRAETRLAA
jgi:hypothetical protein